MKHQNLIQTIGDTPIIKLKRYSPNKKIRLFAKLEGFNPTGSTKDRTALFMIKDALNRNLLKKGDHLIEATSGNTGISLAMLSAIFGFNFTAVMPENVSYERQKMIKQYGAQIILTSGKGGTNYALKIAQNIVRSDKKYLMLNQFTNRANVRAHFETTADEIINDLPQVTHLVAGMGTGGTLTGISQRLKQYQPRIKIIGVEPSDNLLIPGLRNMKEYQPPIFRRNQLNETVIVNNKQAVIDLTRDIIKKSQHFLERFK